MQSFYYYARRRPSHPFFLLAVALLLTACGGGGDGGSNDSSRDGGAPVITTASVSYPLADTGQSACYAPTGGVTNCSGAGQDGSYTSTQPGFRNNGDGTISDLATGLMWQADPGAKTNWYTANGETAPASSTSGAPPAGSPPSPRSLALTLAGYDDWRIPTIKELYGLINFSGQTSTNGVDGKPYIDTTYFVFNYGDESHGERIIDAQYITSTSNVATALNDSETFFGVNFADGRIKAYSKSGSGGNGNAHYALYVRGGASGNNTFTNNGDGAISDATTGLTWAQNDSGPYDWPNALNYCETLSLANATDWRLPNARELQSIVDYRRSPDTTASAAIDPIFSTTQITNEAGASDYPFFWTSTTHLDGPPESMGDHAVYITFGRATGLWNGVYIDVHGAGAQRSDPKTGDPASYNPSNAPQGDVIRIFNYVRCVRGGVY